MIASEEAVAIARARASTQGWGFGDPIRCTLRRGWFGSRDRYEIETNAGRLGTKARFTVDAETGLIVDQGYMPR